MVEKTSSVGASSAFTGQNVQQAPSNNTEKVNSVYTEGAKEKQKLKPVPKPEPKMITHTVKDGESLGMLAAKYNTSVSSIVKLNNIKNPDNLKPGTKLQIGAIDSKDIKAYEDYQSELFNRRYNEKQQKELKQKVESSKAQVVNAKKYGYGEDYSFKVDTKSGDVYVTTKTEKTLGDIRRDFRIPAGSLSKTNNIKGKYKPERVFDLDSGTRFNDYDKADVPVGNSLRIRGADFSPDENRSAWDRFWGNIF